MEPIVANKLVLKERGALSAPLTSLTANPKRDMNSISRILIALLSVNMLMVFIFPLWNIYLDAPQYPEGLGLSIWVNHLAGDINTINGLNHYIGMNTINQEMFSELTYMPFIIIGFAILGLSASIFNKKYLLLSLVLLIVVLGTVGCIDFYNWEYQYGHNLNPHAAIKVPGMSYQPPMLGSKQLLNFTATSWPGFGGFSVIVSGIGLTGILILQYFRKRV